MATGRKPNTDDLELDKAGVATNERGYIKVKSEWKRMCREFGRLETSKADRHSLIFPTMIIKLSYANVYKGKNLTIEHRYLPYSLFTDPQLGRVGITEGAARASGRKFKMGRFPMASVSRAIERDETAGLMKIIVDGENDKILGAAILGSEGGEIVQILGAMMLADAPYTVLKGAVYIHPTLAEGFFGLMESVRPAN